MSIYRRQSFGLILVALFTVACGEVADPLLLDDAPSPGAEDQVSNHGGESSSDEEQPAVDHDPQNSDVLVLPEGAQQLLDHPGGDARQVVYVNFDGPRVDDCGNYCSDAPTNRSWAIGAHFGRSSVDFAAYTDAAGRQAVMDELHRAFGPYDVEFTTARPPAGPYTMLVVSPTHGPNNGVAPLDCDNGNPNDIAYVYEIGGSSPAWIGQAAAHELGHSFGLSHVTNGGDYMHWDSSGDAFTRSNWDTARSNANCFSGSVQDAPGMLQHALGSRGSHPAGCSEVERLAGSGRHATAAAISRSLFPGGADIAVLARDSDQNPDALAAGPLAKKLGGPLLLTATSTLPDATADELNRLGVSTIYVVGGRTAVSAGVVDDLRRRGYAVRRLAGGSRYATAAAVARKTGASSGLAFIASGENAHLVDALAAAGPAGALGAPILLVTHDTIPTATASALADMDVSETIIVGGEASVSSAVQRQLPSPSRISGGDRFATAVAMADYARSRGVSPANVFIGRADKMPDALAAGAAGGIILLSTTDVLPGVSRTFISNHSSRATLLGGPGALGDRVERATCDSLR